MKNLIFIRPPHACVVVCLLALHVQAQVRFSQQPAVLRKLSGGQSWLRPAICAVNWVHKVSA